MQRKNRNNKKKNSSNGSKTNYLAKPKAGQRKKPAMQSSRLQPKRPDGRLRARGHFERGSSDDRLRAAMNTKAGGIFATGRGAKERKALERAMNKAHGAPDGCTPAMEETLSSQFRPDSGTENPGAHYTIEESFTANSTTAHMGTSSRLWIPGMALVESVTPMTKTFTLNTVGFLAIILPSFGQPYQDMGTLLSSSAAGVAAWPDSGTKAEWGSLLAPGISPQTRYAPSAAISSTGYQYAQCRGMVIRIIANTETLSGQQGIVTVGQTDGHPPSFSTLAAWQAWQDSIFASRTMLENINTDIVIPIRPSPAPLKNFGTMPAHLWDGVTNFAAGPYGTSLPGGWVIITLHGADLAGKSIEVEFESQYAYFGSTVAGEIPTFIDPAIPRCIEMCRIASADYKIMSDASRSESDDAQTRTAINEARDLGKKAIAHKSTFSSIADTVFAQVADKGPAVLTKLAEMFL